MEAKRASAIKESFKDYPHQNEPKNSLHLDEKDYTKVLTRFMELAAKELITTGNRILLPSRIGSLQIIKYKPKDKKRFSIDFKTTKKLYGDYNKKNPDNKKVVYFKNRHTSGYKVKLYWRKQDDANFRHKSKWAFKFTRPNIRPNSYNKKNPEVSLVPYIMNHGVEHFHEY